ncbi:MAG: cysteine desulfurase [Nanoarchaeota archaeon]
MMDVEKIRADFPILSRKITYLDNACMSLRPQCVIDALNTYYTQYSACGTRSQHRLGKKVDLEVERARGSIKKLVNARHSEEIIFLRNTTEGINLVANSISLQAGDEVLISDKEHNSNLICWLKLRDEKGIKVVVTKTKKDNTFDMDDFSSKLGAKTRLVSIVHTSNLDGVTFPVKEIARAAHKAGALTLIDAAQSVPHMDVDVREIDCDFLAFSGHKMMGPSGTGVLYGKREALAGLRAYTVGGDTVKDSTIDSYVPEDLPHRFEAGLQDYAGIIGLGVAAEHLMKIGRKHVHAHEAALNTRLTAGLNGMKKIRIIGPPDASLRGGICSFIVDGMDAHNVAGMLDSSSDIMVRSGMHCVHSWFNAHNIKGSVRASMYAYNTEQEIDALIGALKKIAKF